MTITALSVITDAARRCNRLSPGETLDADTAALGFDFLNSIVDKLSAAALFLYKNVLTSAAQTGHITLGAGSWAAISPGQTIFSATQNDLEIAQITMAQYNTLVSPTATGAPAYFAPDGLSTVYLWPVANGQTIKLQTRVGVSQFADQTTSYTVPNGYRNGLGAFLAVRLQPNIAGGMSASGVAELKAEAKSAAGSIGVYLPAIIDVPSFTRSGASGRYPAILYGGA